MKFFLNFCLFFCVVLKPCYGSEKITSRVIAIDGMPGAGKSTSLLKLVSEWENAALLLSELSPEPNCPWKNEPIEVQGKIYHRMWRERMQILKDLSVTNLCFLLDRSYISSLAFAYAFDKFSGHDIYYEKYKQLVEKDLNIDNDFSLLIILDGNPDICLNRRKLCKDYIPWPGTEANFLKAYREFYLVELPKIYKNKIIYINTDDLIPDETLQKIREIVFPYLLKSPVNSSEISKEEIDILLEFGEKNGLGKIHSQPIHIFGYPTIYFRKHSVQLDAMKQPIIFNNERLKFITEELELRNPSSA